MRCALSSDLMSAGTSEKSSIEFYSSLMKVKNDEHVEMEESFGDSETFMARDDDGTPTTKSTNEKWRLQRWEKPYWR